MPFARIFTLLALIAVGRATASAYDAAVLADKPMLYLSMSASAAEPDLSGYGRRGTYYPTNRPSKKTRMPNGDLAALFDGYSSYLEVPSSLSLSVRPGHALTFEAWIRPDTLEFPSQEGSGYVHWAGKGESGNHEYALRMYSLTNTEQRPNRISGYVFNPSGGLGSGSYFEDKVVPGRWIHVAVVIDARPGGKISIYKNAVLRKTTPLSQFNVMPAPGQAPLRVGTRDRQSFFQGAIGKVAVYARALSAERLRAHVDRMRPQ